MKGQSSGVESERMCVMQHLVGPAVGVLQLDVGLLADAVQVFMESVQQEGQQLVRVLLLIARELRREPAHLRLKHAAQTFSGPVMKQELHNHITIYEKYVSANTGTSAPDGISTLKGRGVT